MIDKNLPSNDMEADYDVVFNQEDVIEFNIKTDSDDWKIMQDDLSSNISSGRCRR